MNKTDAAYKFMGENVKKTAEKFFNNKRGESMKVYNEKGEVVGVIRDKEHSIGKVTIEIETNFDEVEAQLDRIIKKTKYIEAKLNLDRVERAKKQAERILKDIKGD